MGPSDTPVPTRVPSGPGPTLANRKGRLRCSLSPVYEIGDSFRISRAATAFPTRAARKATERGFTEPGSRGRVVGDRPSEGHGQGVQRRSQGNCLSPSRREGASLAPRLFKRARAGGAGRGAGEGTISPGGGAHRPSQYTPQTAPRLRVLSWRCRACFPRSGRRGRSDWPARPCSGWPERAEPPDWPLRTCNASSRGGRGGLRVSGLGSRGSPRPPGGSGPAEGGHLY